MVAWGVGRKMGGSAVAPPLAIDTMHRRGRAISMAHSTAFLGRLDASRPTQVRAVGTTTTTTPSVTSRSNQHLRENPRSPPRSPAGWLSQRFPTAPDPRDQHYLRASNQDTPTGSSPYSRTVYLSNSKRNMILPTLSSTRSSDTTRLPRNFGS